MRQQLIDSKKKLEADTHDYSATVEQLSRKCLQINSRLKKVSTKKESDKLTSTGVWITFFMNSKLAISTMPKFAAEGSFFFLYRIQFGMTMLKQDLVMVRSCICCAQTSHGLCKWEQECRQQTEK